MNLTEHFTLEEFQATQHRTIPNIMPTGLFDNAHATCAILEKIRAIVKTPVHINSGYRCAELNLAVGGSKSSRHMVALAADIICPLFGSPIAIAKVIIDSGIVFDQLIYEHTWVHVGASEPGEVWRREVLTLIGPGAYAKGIIAKP